MTKDAVKYVLDTIGESSDIITPLLSVKCIRIDVKEDKYPKINRHRFKIDTSNEILICYICRKYDGKIPDNWILNKHYDVYDGITYKYLFDEKTMEPYVDIYDFSAITVIEYGG